MAINSGTGNSKPRTEGGIYSGSGKNVTKVYKPQDAVANDKKTKSEKLKKEEKALQAAIKRYNQTQLQRYKDANARRNAEIKLGTYDPSKSTY